MPLHTPLFYPSPAILSSPDTSIVPEHQIHLYPTHPTAATGYGLDVPLSCPSNNIVVGLEQTRPHHSSRIQQLAITTNRATKNIRQSSIYIIPYIITSTACQEETLGGLNTHTMCNGQPFPARLTTQRGACFVVAMS